MPATSVLSWEQAPAGWLAGSLPQLLPAQGFLDHIRYGVPSLVATALGRKESSHREALYWVHGPYCGQNSLRLPDLAWLN